MHPEKLGDGIGSFGELENNHNLFFANNKLWLFGLKFKNQPTHNFGNHVVHTGSYVLIFSLDSKKWEKIEFPSITEEENLSECLFVSEGEIYILLFTNFGSVAFKRLCKWNGSSFVDIPLKTADEKVTEPTNRVTVVHAIGKTSNNEDIFIANGEGMHSFKLNILNGNAEIKALNSFHEESSSMSGSAVSAIIHNDKLAVAFGVVGCGFRWMPNNLIIVDLNTMEVNDVNIPSEGYEHDPHFCFSGANAHSVTRTLGWIHATGMNQVGMCSSKFDGSVWELKDVFGSPKWLKHDGEIVDSHVTADKNSVYSVSKDAVNVYTIA